MLCGGLYLRCGVEVRRRSTGGVGTGRRGLLLVLVADGGTPPASSDTAAEGLELPGQASTGAVCRSVNSSVGWVPPAAVDEQAVAPSASSCWYAPSPP